MPELRCEKAYFEDTDKMFTPGAIPAQVPCSVDKIVHGQGGKSRYFVAVARLGQSEATVSVMPSALRSVAMLPGVSALARRRVERKPAMCDCVRSASYRSLC